MSSSSCLCLPPYHNTIWILCVFINQIFYWEKIHSITNPTIIWNSRKYFNPSIMNTMMYGDMTDCLELHPLKKIKESLKPWPLAAITVGTWYVRIFQSRLVSNITSKASKIAILTQLSDKKVTAEKLPSSHCCYNHRTADISCFSLLTKNKFLVI